MIRALDTLVARLLLVSLLGISLVHLLSLWTYQHALDQELKFARESGLADRLLTIKRSVMLVPEAQREKLAHDLSGGSIEAHWTRKQGAVAGGPGVETWQGLTAQIRTSAQDLRPEDIVVGTTTDPHVALVSLRLPDDSWINISVFAAGRAQSSAHGRVLSSSLMALGVVLVSFLMAGWLTKPLRRMADAVTTLSPEDAQSAVPEAGPKEVRQLAVAFNGMHRRLADLIVRRTRSLAAVSHDLRTPLTRLKLRIDDVGSPELQLAMARDIGEMEQMIDATLSYLKGGETEEPMRRVELVALLQTIVDDMKDAGHDATLWAPNHVVVQARLVALKRAFANLVGNALRFGSKVGVSVEATDHQIIVAVEDNGPGIPEDKLAVVLEPFVRLEDSRNAETGGVGLGLTIAKAQIEANGGTLVLRNRPEGCPVRWSGRWPSSTKPCRRASRWIQSCSGRRTSSRRRFTMSRKFC